LLSIPHAPHEQTRTGNQPTDFQQPWLIEELAHLEAVLAETVAADSDRVVVTAAGATADADVDGAEADAAASRRRRSGSR